MRQIATLLLITIFFSSNAQDIGGKDSISRKENEQFLRIIEKQEKSATINLLTNKYSNQIYKRFDGKISILNENTIKYDDKVLIILNTSSELKRIFEIGILYPNVFIETRKNDLDSTLIEDSLVIKIKLSRKESWHSIFNRTDSLTISNFKEQKGFSKSPRERTFEFLLFFKGFANPTEYIIELTNDNATNETNLESFINGARLILVMKGSILI